MVLALLREWGKALLGPTSSTHLWPGAGLVLSPCGDVPRQLGQEPGLQCDRWGLVKLLSQASRILPQVGKSCFTLDERRNAACLGNKTQAWQSNYHTETDCANQTFTCPCLQHTQHTQSWQPARKWPIHRERGTIQLLLISQRRGDCARVQCSPRVILVVNGAGQRGSVLWLPGD